MVVASRPVGRDQSVVSTVLYEAKCGKWIYEALFPPIGGNRFMK